MGAGVPVHNFTLGRFAASHGYSSTSQQSDHTGVRVTINSRVMFQITRAWLGELASFRGSLRSSEERSIGCLRTCKNALPMLYRNSPLFIDYGEDRPSARSKMRESIRQPSYSRSGNTAARKVTQSSPFSSSMAIKFSNSKLGQHAW